ncbi:hypothetical protein ACOME3_000428 [Neoechinorhynchus agilis]
MSSFSDNSQMDDKKLESMDGGSSFHENDISPSFQDVSKDNIPSSEFANLNLNEEAYEEAQSIFVPSFADFLSDTQRNFPDDFIANIRTIELVHELMIAKMVQLVVGDLNCTANIDESAQALTEICSWRNNLLDRVPLLFGQALIDKENVIIEKYASIECALRPNAIDYRRKLLDAFVLFENGNDIEMDDDGSVFDESTLPPK